MALINRDALLKSIHEEYGKERAYRAIKDAPVINVDLDGLQKKIVELSAENLVLKQRLEKAEKHWWEKGE
jgi:hypothetical protein